MNVSIHQDKFHRIIFRSYRITKINKSTQTLRNLLCYYQELGCMKYPNEESMNKILAYNYDARFRVRISTFGSYSLLQYTLKAVDPCFINDNEYTVDLLKQLFLDCINPVIKNNCFDEDLFLRAYEIYETDLLREDNYNIIAVKEMIKNYFKDTDRDFETSGNLEELQNITVNDLYQYYLSVLNEESISIVSSRGKAYINNDQITLTPKHNYHFKNRAECEKIIYKSADCTQCYLNVVYETKTYPNDELFYPMVIINYFLGGSSSSLLFNLVREKYGLCYNISSTYMGATGIILISVVLDKKNIDFCLKAIDEALQEIRLGHFNLDEAKRFFIANYKGEKDYQETQILNYIYDNYFLDNPKSYEDINLVKKITNEDIYAALNNLEQTFIYAYGGIDND